MSSQQILKQIQDTVTISYRHDESPRSPTCDVLPLPNNLSDSVESSKPTPHPTQQHPPPTSQSLEVPVSTFQPLQNISNQQFVHTQLYQPKPTPPQSPTPPNKRQKISSKRCGFIVDVMLRENYVAKTVAAKVVVTNRNMKQQRKEQQYGS
ncbi:hypothetical protein K1719_002780 [Acacia pycnantha]|nr:hypothetical protein K1719_002780 [Acacia pycnantha]